MALLDETPHAMQVTTRNPGDGSTVATYPLGDRAAVDAAVERARAGATWWREQGFRGRRDHLVRFKAAIATNAQELAEVISAETGKPGSDALIEIMLTLGHLDWAAKNAKRVLRRQKVKAGLMNFNQRATVGYEPYGVIGVIGPWNYPLYTPMGSISYALAAGNAVVFKPSELTPGPAVWLAEQWARTVGHDVLVTVTGDGSTGSALAASRVNKIAFTGSTATAKKVMATASQRLTPIVAECGGKDAVLVAADADLDVAADFIVLGGMGNAGQTCAGVERVYVVDSVRDELVRRVVERASRLRAGGPDAHYGPMTLAAQTDVVRRHVEDALRSGTAVLGGPESIGGRTIAPIVITDVDEMSDAMQCETFGPLVVVNRVTSLDEAVRRANATPYGLAAAVFTRSRATADRAAAALHTGAVSINSVLGFASVGALPFGGVKESGFGRIHGADGLREFSTAKSVARQTRKAMVDLSMERTDKDVHMVARMIPMLHGRSKGSHQ
ncbi:aldehyde dehydrogenase family protein [Actinotalea sp. M2MS4P-6]|uniref:aldehyde dehydrogenase family protein n=1 Tax=Actinotalea sp. M2MS4P-6 TaxID=2983762 RepID=UPI0021E4AA6E|nr:aldehyde dehydrogenase family protein [Actinotalea sp. M2MS4P-6]MCV2396223.1 aldehyde dehydrogenase family protein [Actinotalea sp. M2MS4P-6]